MATLKTLNFRLTNEAIKCFNPNYRPKTLK